MSRKPFAEINPRGADAWTCHNGREGLIPIDVANAAIAQDKAHHNEIRDALEAANVKIAKERDEYKSEYENACKFATDYEQQRDALRADNARQAEEWRKARVENCALREEVAALNATNKKDGEDIQKLLQEIERLKAQVGAEQLDADRVRLASRELQAENERLKELQGVPGVSEKGLMAVGEELIRLKTQLAEAVTLLRGCTSTGCAFVVPEPDTFGTADMCDCRHKAREFLAKAKP